ncbi:MAG: CDP-diacylglycerol--serine O-phosphatidyltransferase [Pseudomonadota bacterium]
MTDQEPTQQTEIKQRKGIYLLPNLFTTACLFSGFYAIVAAMHNRFEAAAVAIFIAMVMDGLDGRVARLTNTQSAFGAQYDSLADMISFGLAPALVIYVWALSGLGKLGWLAAFVYTACAALRLARFNIQIGVADKRYFTGLASPAAAAAVAGLVWLGHDWQFSGKGVMILAFIVTLGVGFLMVSTFRYRSFKDIDLKGKVPFVTVLMVMLIYVSIAMDPPTVLFSIFLAYALSGPVLMLIAWFRGRDKRGSPEDSDEDDEKTA